MDATLAARGQTPPIGGAWGLAPVINLRRPVFLRAELRSAAGAVALAALALAWAASEPQRGPWFLAAQAAVVGLILLTRRFGVPPAPDRDEVLQTVSHDLRAPLAATEGYIKHLVECEPGSLSPQQIELLNTALANLNRLEHFVSDMLDLARLDAGRARWNLQEADLRPAAEEVLRLFRFTSQSREVWLFNLIDPSLPRVRMDRDKVRRILTNLISNAIKFIDVDGRVALSAAVRGRELVVTVSDTGIGMSERALRELFERFAEPGQPREGACRGAGLGLWIVRRLVEGHGGRVWAESKPGAGSRFHFTLPLA